MIKRLLYYNRVVFVKQCIAWTLYGDLDDSTVEFFIFQRTMELGSSRLENKGDENFRKQALNGLKNLSKEFQESKQSYQAISSTHKAIFDWMTSYSIRLDFLPESQVNLRLATKILFCGKAIKLLQLSHDKSLVDLFNEGDLKYFAASNSSVDLVKASRYQQKKLRTYEIQIKQPILM